MTGYLQGINGSHNNKILTCHLRKILGTIEVHSPSHVWRPRLLSDQILYITVSQSQKVKSQSWSSSQVSRSTGMD